MKLLDKYFFDIFILAIVVFLVVFLILFIIIDFAAKIDNFISIKAKDVFIPLFILEFYLYRIPFFLLLLLPVAVLFASIFTLLKFMRNNELVPIMVCGISLKRVILPFLISAIVCGIIIAIIEEFVMPSISEKIAETENIVKNENLNWNVIINDNKGNYFVAENYDHIERTMSNVVISFISDGQIKKLAYAKKIKWEKKSNRWILFDGRIDNYDVEYISKDESKRPKHISQKFGSEGLPIDSDLKPVDISRSNSLGSEYQHFKETLELANRYPWVPSFWMKVHQRISFPLSSIILLLVGLPLVMEGGAKSLFKGLFLCFIISLGYYALTFLLSELGTRGDFPPLMAAWTPTFIFGGLGIFFFSTMKT